MQIDMYQSIATIVSKTVNRFSIFQPVLVYIRSDKITICTLYQHQSGSVNRYHRQQHIKISSSLVIPANIYASKNMRNIVSV